MDAIPDVVLNCVQPKADKAAVLNKRDDSTSSRGISNVSFVNLEVQYPAKNRNEPEHSEQNAGKV